MESWILPVSCKVNVTHHINFARDPHVTLTLQETRSIHDSMNLSKIEFIAYIYILL